MEERRINVIFNTAGSGSITNRVTIPKKWIDRLGITKENRGVLLKFDGEKIIIEKEKVMINTLDYILGTEDTVETGKEYYFGELYNGCDEEEIIDSGCVAMWDEGIEEERIVYFEIIDKDNDDPLKTLVRVTEIR